MIGTTYFDTMDRDRYVRPLKDLGTEYECEVFWSESGRSVSAGRTKLSKKLFDPECSVGFRVYIPEPAPNAGSVTDEETFA